MEGFVTLLLKRKNKCLLLGKSGARKKGGQEKKEGRGLPRGAHPPLQKGNWECFFPRTFSREHLAPKGRKKRRLNAVEGRKSGAAFQGREKTAPLHTLGEGRNSWG